jgi:hypothetical protein
VIPVLVSGAQMPDRHDLPEGLEAFARRNALELSDRRWRYDVGQLISTLDELLAETTAVHVAPSTADAAGAAEAAPNAASTGRAQIPTAARDRGRAGEWLRGHGRLLAGVGALALLGVVLAILVLGGGSGGGGNPGFEPFTGAHAFKTVDVPAGWSPREGDDVDMQFSGREGSGLKTILTDPDKEGTVEILQEAPSPSPQEHAREVLLRRVNDDGAKAILPADQRSVGGPLAWLIEYTWNEEGLGPATVATYFFNRSQLGWRTRAAVAGTAGDSAGMAEAIATRMASTLEPR